MKIVLTGSLGRITKPLARELIWDGHAVTVISSRAEMETAIKELGASAAIGRLKDVDFLTTTFRDADAVYCMTPMPDLWDARLDLVAYYQAFGPRYLEAIRRSNVGRVVHLSSVGAHMAKGNGILRYAHEIEGVLHPLPAGVSVTFMRPVGFYDNLLALIPAIKQSGAISSNYGGDDQKPWVSPVDIASACAEELTSSRPQARKIRYVASDELSCHEVARLLGTAIGKPDLKWHLIPDHQMLDTLTKAGMNPTTAQGFVEMNGSMHSGKLYEDYHRVRPALGKVKMRDFAEDFARAYYQESLEKAG